MPIKLKHSKIKYILNRDAFYKDLKKKLEKFQSLVKLVYVFGSFVDGFPRIDSDIDILIVIPDNRAKERHVLKKRILDELFPEFFPVDLIILTEREFDLNKDSYALKHAMDEQRSFKEAKNNRKIKALKRLERAKRSLNSAKILLDQGEIADSISRSYFAAYHASMSILELLGVFPKSHQELIHDIHENYVKLGLVGKDFVRMLQHLLKHRIEADYGYIVSFFEKEDAMLSIDYAELLIQTANKIIKNKSKLSEFPNSSMNHYSRVI